MADFGVISGPALALGIASVATTIGTTAIAVNSAKEQGEAQQQMLNFEASQLEEQAEEERAIATREVAEQRRQRDLVLSRARAAGASSGGGRDFDLEAEIEEDAEYRRLTALYDGNVRARNARTSAGARRFEGAQSARAGSVNASAALVRGGSTIAGQAGSMYAKYN